MARAEFLNSFSTPVERATEASLHESTLARGGALAAVIALLASGPVLAAAIGTAALYLGVRSSQNGRKAEILMRGGKYEQRGGLQRLLKP